MKIIDVVKLSSEVISSEGQIRGWDTLSGIFKGGKEGDPNYVFRTTYPTAEIKNLLEAVNEKFNGKRVTGFFEILGGYGTGKSRILILLWHLFKNKELAIKWAESHNIKLNLPENIKLLAFNLLDQAPEYLWEPIFRGLGREDLLKKVKDFPGYNLLKEALSGNDFVILIIDELEAWYTAKEDVVRRRNLNFLQVLAEAACEEGGKLLVFCSLYGEAKDLLARIGRVNPYRVNLTLSKDRCKIILFRLFDEVNSKLASEIIEKYVQHYVDSEVDIGDRLEYEKKMRETYPIHPELMEALLTRFSSSPNYQNTRGVLGLLASVVYKKASDVDLILASDVDMSEGELLTLDRVLTENAIKDAELIGKEEIRKLLNAILLYSFGEFKKAGASRNDVILAVLRPGININDVDSLLGNLPNIAPHVWFKDHRYIIGCEANPVTIIQNKALENINKGEISGALDLIKTRLRKDLSYVVYHPDESYSDCIEDEDRLKVAVSLKTLDESEINEFYKGKNYANRLILYIPKKGDITEDKDLLIIAERIRLYDQYEKEADEENRRLLEAHKSKDIRHLADKLSDIYGYWVRVTSFENGKIRYRLISCSLDEVKSTVMNSYDSETVRDEIINHLEMVGRETWLKVEDLKHDFKTIPGKPIIIVESVFEEALKSLYNEGKLIISYKGKLYKAPEPIPFIKDDMKIILTKYAPPQLELEEEGKEEEKLKADEEKTIIEKFPGGIGESEEGITQKIKGEILSRVIEIPECQTIFRLSEEMERRIPQDAKIQRLRIDFLNLSFENVDSFISFISSSGFKKARFPNINMQITIEEPLDKSKAIELVNKLPASLRVGTIKAFMEVKENV
jgi:hypothetical protein